MLTVLGKKGGKKPHEELGLSVEDLKRLYETMVRVRVFDEKMIKLQRSGRIGFYVPALGQEACHIGAAFALDDSDWIFPHYRDPGIPLLRGITIQEMVHQLYGNAADNTKGRQMPNHFSYKDINFVSISSPLATQIIQAAGAAYAAKIKKDGKVVLTSFGDGSTSEGDFHAGMNLAGVHALPIVFLCENNQWAISVPVSLQTGSESFAIKAQAYGFDGVKVDGNDILAVYKAAKESVEKARSGRGPTLIEAVTYRMGPHSTSDDPTRYTPEGELEAWKKKDPIERFKEYLRQVKVWDEEWENELRTTIAKEVDDAVKKAEATDPPAPDTLFEDVFAELPAQLLAQKDEMKRLIDEYGMPEGH
ncbi:MAG: pyruvate dehydrogenase (acetyl-transferring) E1 component subunit alpha [Euryarchaeota archaeon]|nr:pyruvate dehydrogenase (acetyl-transferring) E1 component subunit alpha [Euryarchaeota archaeon]